MASTRSSIRFSPRAGHGRLRLLGIDSLTVGGLATNICVRSTALDARRLGFEVTLATDATRGVDIEQGDTERAIAEMRAAGVQCVTVAEVTQGATRPD
ncbi:MAG: isochorismatase family protein [Gaiellaceae bacterium]